MARTYYSGSLAHRGRRKWSWTDLLHPQPVWIDDKSPVRFAKHLGQSQRVGVYYLDPRSAPLSTATYCESMRGSPHDAPALLS